MKQYTPPNLILNTPSTSTLCSVKAFGRKWTLSQKTLTPSSQSPILFVYSHDTNPWATDLMTQFCSHLSAWYEGGTLPECQFIATTNDRSELQEQILTHPFITGTETPKASHIITIGDWCSHEVARIRCGYQLTHISQIFCVQTDPQEIDLLVSKDKPLPNTCGVFGKNVSSYQKARFDRSKAFIQILKLLALYLHHKVHLIYTVHLQQAADLIQKECHQQDLQTRVSLLSSRTSPHFALNRLAGKVDAIITLRDTTAYRYMDEIIQFCNTHAITLVTSELASVYRGAALGFGNALECMSHI